MFNFQTVSKPSSRLNQPLKNSVLDKPIILDNSYIEYALISMWLINIIDHIKLKASLAKQFHIQPSEIDNMSYWEYEYFIKCLNDIVKEENDEQQNQMNKYDINKIQRSQNKYKNFNFNTPKIPKMPSF